MNVFSCGFKQAMKVECSSDWLLSIGSIFKQTDSVRFYGKVIHYYPLFIDNSILVNLIGV